MQFFHAFASMYMREKNLLCAQEIYKGLYANHFEGWSIAQMVLWQRYYWLTLKIDAQQFGKRCYKCQHFTTIQRQPSQELSVVFSPQPFAQWRIDLIGPLPKGRGSVYYVIVAIDYFTKWVEAESLTKIIEANQLSQIMGYSLIIRRSKIYVKNQVSKRTFLLHTTRR